MIYPDPIGPTLGNATLIIRDHTDSKNPPPPRELQVTVTRVARNPDGSYSMPDGSLFCPPGASVAPVSTDHASTISLPSEA